jgi:hypothetical protein
VLPETDIETARGTEAEETGEERAVWLWRCEQLVRSGDPEVYASMLASDRAVDLDFGAEAGGEARLPAGARGPDPALRQPEARLRPSSYVRMQDLTPVVATPVVVPSLRRRTSSAGLSQPRGRRCR